MEGNVCAGIAKELNSISQQAWQNFLEVFYLSYYYYFSDLFLSLTELLVTTIVPVDGRFLLICLSLDGLL